MLVQHNSNINCVGKEEFTADYMNKAARILIYKANQLTYHNPIQQQNLPK